MEILEEVSKLLENYEDLGIKSREYYFLRDVEYSLQKNRTLSSRQESWLTALLQRASLDPIDPDSLAKIEGLLNLDKVPPNKKRILFGLRATLARGKTLSLKQTALLEDIEEQLISFKSFIPNKDSIEELRAISKLGKSRSNGYWKIRSGEFQALKEITSWLEWHDFSSTEKEPLLDVWSVHKLKNSFKKQLQILEDPPHKVSSMRMIKIGQSFIPTLVIGNPFIADSGDIVYPVLVNGKYRAVRSLIMPSDE